MQQALTLGIHRLGDAYRSAVSAVTVTNTESSFVEKGTLTPDEFLQAGDKLTFSFPTWKWEAGDPSKRGSHLPDDRQFLITRNVPCKDRVRALDYILAHKTRTEDDWLLPETAAGGDDAGGAGELRDVDDLAAGASGGFIAGDDDAGAEGGGICIEATEDFLDLAGGGSAPSAAAASAPAAPLPDYGDLNAELEEEDPACLGAGKPGGYLVADAPDENVVRTRTYDLSITYDKYYQTPRLWLFGYDESGMPLKPDQVYEDVLSEYVAKTVTVDPHPLTGVPTVSIHPCKHALVMKKVVNDWIEQGIEPRHDLAIFVFLKFISGVVPTINYDFTMDIEF